MTHLRATGLQPNEQELPEGEQAAPAAGKLSVFIVLLPEGFFLQELDSRFIVSETWINGFQIPIVFRIPESFSWFLDLKAQDSWFSLISESGLSYIGRSVDGRKSTESSFTYYRGSACFLLYSTNIFINLNLICLSAEVQIDESVVMQLVSMGFDKEGCRKAVYHTNNQGMIILITLFRWWIIITSSSS